MSWLPFYHDMGLVFAICLPVIAQRRAVLMSPMAFLQRPARWMQLLASNSHTFSAAPNFAFELAARRTTDNDLAGLDLGNVLAHHQRQRTHPCRNDRALQQAVRSVRSQRGGDAAVVWARGGNCIRGIGRPGPAAQGRPLRLPGSVKRSCKAMWNRRRQAAPT